MTLRFGLFFIALARSGITLVACAAGKFVPGAWCALTQVRNSGTDSSKALPSP